MFFQSVTQVFRRKKSEYRPKRCRTYGPLAPVPKRPINANPGLKILFHFCTYLPMHFLDRVTFFVIIIESRRKEKTVFSKL